MPGQTPQATTQKHRSIPQPTAPKQPNRLRRPNLAAGAAVGIGWLWSMGLLLQRVHMVRTYTPFSGASVLAECTQALLVAFHPTLFWITFLALGVGWMAGRTWATGGRRWARGMLFAGFYLLPGLELARLAWPAVPTTFLEPIALALLTGAVVRDFVRLTVSTSGRPAGGGPLSFVWFPAVVIAAAGLGLWWFWISHRGYVDYQLGYFDFGHFARRVINTWRGYGFLQQTPGLPAFWDHFNPGLASLALLWPLWPDAHLFFAIQAVCLALPSVLVYGIARRLGATPAGAAAWALAWLTWPVVGQLNYNFSLGWHPVSLAIPLMLAAAYCLVSQRKWAALLLAIAACSFKEDVLIATVGLAVGLALLAWRERKVAARLSVPSDGPDAGGPPQQPWGFAWLPRPWVSLIAAAGFLAATAAVFAVAGFSAYQVARFNNLGGNVREIVLSPFLRPSVFWPTVFSRESLYFVLILFLPFGLANALRGWPLQVALMVPLGTLLAWQNIYAKSIAFQYVTCLIVVIMFAALVGARRSAFARARPAAAMATYGAAALATALCMSLVFGELPSTPPTDPFHVAPTDRPAYDAHCRQLDRLAAMIDRPDAYVLASGRVASHLLKVKRLEPLSDFYERQSLLDREAGPGKTATDLFEWVLLDKSDDARDGRATLEAAARHFIAAGFEVRYDRDDIVLLHRARGR